MTDDEFENEVERRLSASLSDIGEEPWSDSDRAMYLRQDIANEIREEKRKKTNIDRLRDAVEENK